MKPQAGALYFCWLIILSCFQKWHWFGSLAVASYYYGLVLQFWMIALTFRKLTDVLVDSVICNLTFTSVLRIPSGCCLHRRHQQVFHFHRSETTCLSKPALWLPWYPSMVKTVVLHGCRSNMCPENSTANNHDFQMHCFEETTSCKACSMLLRYFASLAVSLSFSPSDHFLKKPVRWGWISPSVVCRGIFFQGYRCTRCKMAAHKECLGRVPACGRNSGLCTCISVCIHAIYYYPNYNFLHWLFSWNYRPSWYWPEGKTTFIFDLVDMLK